MKIREQQLEEESVELREKQHFCLKNISNDDDKVRFTTGSATMSALMVCFNLLGPTVNKLNYWASSRSTIKMQSKSNKGRKRSLSPLEEFFLVLVRLHLGLFEQDITYRFSISQSTVSQMF